MIHYPIDWLDSEGLMLGRKERDQLELFISGSARDLVPDDYILARVDRVLDLSWLRDEVADCYCTHNGRPGIDPEVAVRLMLAGFLLGIVHDRRLLREAQVNLAIRWFVGYGLHEELPDHSSLTRIRQRWGSERFRNIFKRTVKACIAAKIATGEIVHIDASLIRANVSWDALAVHHVNNVEAADQSKFEWEDRQSGKYKKICTTDPDATMATNGRNRRLEPAYKQHTAVDDLAGVVVDVEVATGEENEGMAVEARLDANAATTRSTSKRRPWMAVTPTPRFSGRWKTARLKPLCRRRPNSNRARSSQRGVLNSTPNIIWCVVQSARSCDLKASSSGAPSNTFTREAKTVGPVRYGHVV
jgi:transposase